MCYSYFHDNWASLTRASSLSSHISPTMWAMVDPLGFAQVRQSRVAIVGPHTGAREGTTQRPARGGRLHRPSAFPSKIARHRGASQYPLRERGVIQDLNTGLTMVWRTRIWVWRVLSLAAASTPWPPPNKPFYLRRSRTSLKTSLMLTCDSITVSSTWELTSVSMRYSQGDGVNTSLSRLVYCPHVIIIYLCSFPVYVRASSLARSCATKDSNNKDNVCTPNIPAGIKCPPPSKTISPITWFETISTRLAGMSSILKPGTL